MKNKENQILNHVYWNKALYGFTNMFSSIKDIEKSEQVSDNTVYVHVMQTKLVALECYFGV